LVIGLLGTWECLTKKHAKPQKQQSLIINMLSYRIK